MTQAKEAIKAEKRKARAKRKRAERDAQKREKIAKAKDRDKRIQTHTLEKKLGPSFVEHFFTRR